MDPATGQEKEILSRRTRIAPPSFSPKEDRIAFTQPVAAGAAQLFVGSLDGREVRQVTQGGREQNIIPQWSADGACSISTGYIRNNRSVKFPWRAARAAKSRLWTFEQQGTRMSTHKVARSHIRRLKEVNPRPRLFEI